MLFFFVTQVVKREWPEAVTIALVKLVVELDPMKTERVQESRQTFHHEQDEDCQCKPGGKSNHKADRSKYSVVSCVRYKSLPTHKNKK